MQKHLNTAFNQFDDFDDNQETLFKRIAKDIYSKGYSINPSALSENLGNNLLWHLSTMNEEKFEDARIGRDNQLMKNNFVRSDEICWITGESNAGREWLHWTRQLKEFLNQRLFLGLFSFESHFSHYSPGDFYKRHVDAFKGSENRRLSIIVYLNPDWLPENEGELILYTGEHNGEGIKVRPSFGTIVVFLSEDFPHEVLPANRDRYSIAGWFRVNSSTEYRADPPL